MEKLKQLLQERGIEIVSEKQQPDGAKRLVLRKGDRSTLEITLTRELLQGTRDSAVEYIEQLLSETPTRQMRRP